VGAYLVKRVVLIGLHDHHHDYLGRFLHVVWPRSHVHRPCGLKEGGTRQPSEEGIGGRGEGRDAQHAIVLINTHTRTHVHTHT